jgi:uncharacterized protein
MKFSMSERAQELVDWFRAGSPNRFVIALSGGVDSAVVAQAAVLSGCDCLAATAISASVSQRERRDADELAACIGIQHVHLSSGELNNADYRRNDQQRCYHCKSNLFSLLRSEFPEAQIVTGTNQDDLGDYRPGLQAAAQHDVRSPLAELGLTKQDIRSIADHWKLAVAEKPASPCLASRIAYGVPVTEARLRRIDAAEQILRELGMTECRVRLHEDELARIEVPASNVAQLVSETVRKKIVEQFKQLGFTFVTIDLEGFRSGSLNAVVQLSRPN